MSKSKESEEAEELKEAMEELDDILTQGLAAVLGLFKKMAGNKDISKHLATFCRNNYNALKEVGFTDEEALQLTATFLRSSSGK